MSFNNDVISTREVRSAGTKPNTIAQAHDSAIANISTEPSTEVSR